MKKLVKKTALLAVLALFTTANVLAQEPVKKEKKEVKTEQCCKKHKKSDCKKSGKDCCKKSNKKSHCQSECKKSDKAKKESNCSKKSECCKSKKEKK